MKNLIFLIAVSVFLAVSSCNTIQPDEKLQNEAVLKSGQKVMNFRAHLSGDEEVPAVETNATGQAIFQLSKDGMELSYKIIVANIENVRMSHIHLGPAGSTGGVVVWLYPSGPPPVVLPGTTNGILAEGVITAGNLTGVLAGQPLWDLVEAMMNGGTYVNVHTDANPGGEIRGQIK